MLFKALAFVFARPWFLYALMGGALLYLLNTSQIADDVLNASRPSADYVQEYSYGLKEYNPIELRQAADYYETLVSGNLKTPFIYANLGFCYFYLHNVPKAIDMYHKALAKDPGLYVVYYDLGMIAMFEGDDTTAAQCFQKSLDVLPKNRQQLIYQFHINPKHWTSPVVAEDSIFVRRLKQDTQLLYANLGAMYLNLKQYNAVLALTEDAIKVNSTDPQIYFNAGVASYSLGLIKEAALLLTKAIDLAPNYAEAYFARSQLMHALGRDDIARDDLAKSKESETRGPWKRSKTTLDLHHWNDAILFFQVYH